MRSDSRCNGMAAIALLAEKTQTGVSGVIGTGVSPRSSGPLPRACPIARFSTTRP